MPDLEKAIRVLEGNYKNSVLRSNGELITVTDIIALLKERESMRPGLGKIHHDDGSASYFLHCPFDGTTLVDGDNYCRRCGRAVKWE